MMSHPADTITVMPFRAPSLDRFLAKIAIDDATGCWEWTASRFRNGYGQFRLEQTTTTGQRAAWILFVGPIPDGLHIDHLCRNRGCVNPDHLEPVTCRENLLRGETFQAANAAKTHCPEGHPYAGANLGVSRGARYCRACKNAGKRRRRAERKAA